MTAVLEVMRDPSLYGPGVARVDVAETHISWVFLAGERAYKVKKPVRMPFLDYRSLAARQAFCEQEVRLNRRLAPHLYLGVRALAQTARGYSLADADDPDAVEYVVEMRRIGPGHTLAEQLRASTAPEDALQRVAVTVARFHARAEHAGDAKPFADAVRQCADSLLEVRPTLLTRALRSALLRVCDEHADELGVRAQRGLVRDGHGDLRCEHVVLDDRVQIFDCIEFDGDLRRTDVGADLAFLAMDLEQEAGRAAAERLVAAYRAAGGDPGSPRLFALFCAYRAAVRALVTLLRARQLAGLDRTAALGEGDRLIRLAWRFLWRRHLPLVLALCGPAASGKSTLAAELDDLTGLQRLSSDRLRKRIGGLAAGERGEEWLYANGMTSRVYRALGREAKAAAGGAIVDATFRRHADRDAFLDAFGPGAPVFVRCLVSEAVLAQRARLRERDARRESDADAVRAVAQAREFDPITEVPPHARLYVSTAPPVDVVAATLEAMLARSVPTTEDDRAAPRERRGDGQAHTPLLRRI